MLRFPNPGSTIENFVRIYSQVFNALGSQVSTLDEITSVAVAANLATSSGYMGDEAIARATREDRSRDPLYNQSKMYAELYRALGWLHPTQNTALNYTCTLLGEQIVAAGSDFWPLMEECVLGIVYPNPILSVKGDFDLRPFAFILRVMDKLNGYLSRDEIIFGPLSTLSDRRKDSTDSVIATIKAARASATSAKNAVNKVAKERGISTNTLGNYTRWPIALLRDLGWAEKGFAKFDDGKKYQAWFLTEKGKRLANRLHSAIDIRVDDLSKLAPEQRSAFAVVAHFKMMERSGFDIAPVEVRISESAKIIDPLIAELGGELSNILLSPFQSLSIGEIANIFPRQIERTSVTNKIQPITDRPEGRGDRSHLFVPPTFIQSVSSAIGPEAIRNELFDLLEECGTVKKAAHTFAEMHINDTQTEFYPLVTHLFQVFGFNSDYSRAGVNYQRWDACVWANDYALPIEIKSPTEEQYLSTKAVRQALENKIILLARGGLNTRPDLSSLVVGYRIPNERSEMSNLIDDVFSAYGLRLGVIDLASLTHLALLSIKDNVTIDSNQLCQLKGFLNV